MTRPRSHSQIALTVRPAEPGDAKDVWLWRNDRTTRANSGNSAPIPWSDHKDWFSSALDDPGRFIRIVMTGSATSTKRGEPIAVVRIDRLSKVTRCWLVNLNLCPAFRGQGLGRPVLVAACRAFFDEHGVQILRAEIHPHNIASRRVFSALGFSLTDRPRTNELDLYERPAVLLPKPSELRGT